MYEEDIDDIDVPLDTQAKYFYHIQNYSKAADTARDAINEQCEKIENLDINLLNLFVSAIKEMFNEERDKYFFYENELKNVESQPEDKNKETQKKLKKTRLKDLMLGSREKFMSNIESIISTFYNVYKACINSIRGDYQRNPRLCQILVFAKKTLGDFYRYRLELSKYKAEIDENKSSAEKSYKEGIDVSKYLDYLDPFKLANELNYGVFLFHNKNDKNAALDLYKTIMANIASGKHQTKEAVSILQQMDMNIVIWENNTEVKADVIPEINEDDNDY